MANNKRESIKDRKISVGISFDDRMAKAEADANKIKAQLSGTEPEDAPSPAQEAENEFQANQPRITLAKETVSPARPAEEVQKSQLTVVDVVYGVYSNYKKFGVDQNTATGLTIAYALMELAIASQARKT